MTPCNHAEEEAENNEGELATAKDKKALRRQRQKEKKVEKKADADFRPAN